MFVFQVAAQIIDPTAIERHAVTMPDPKVIWGIIGTMCYGAVHGAIWLFNRRKKLAKLASAFQEGPQESGQGAQLQEVLMELVNAIQNNIHHERQERLNSKHQEDRRWERIESLLELVRAQTHSTRELLLLVQQTMRQHDEFRDKIVKISDWIRDEERRHHREQRRQAGG